MPGAAGAVLPAGALVEAGAALSIIERGARLQPAMIDMTSEVAKNNAPRIAVARDKALAWPRPVMKPPPPPMPSAPPSERCRSTTPDKRDHDQEVDDNEDGLHLLALEFQQRLPRRPISWAAPSMAQEARPCQPLKSAALSVGRRYADKIGRLQAGAADQRAVDIGQVEQFPRRWTV